LAANKRLGATLLTDPQRRSDGTLALRISYPLIWASREPMANVHPPSFHAYLYYGFEYAVVSPARLTLGIPIPRQHPFYPPRLIKRAIFPSTRYLVSALSPPAICLYHHSSHASPRRQPALTLLPPTDY